MRIFGDFEWKQMDAEISEREFALSMTEYKEQEGRQKHNAHVLEFRKQG